jgi:DNA-binding phage protein
MGFEKYYSNMIKEKIVDPAGFKLSAYFKQQAIEREKAEKAAQEAAAKKQKELDQIADDAGVDRVELDKPVIKKDKPKIAGEAASAHTREKWVYEVVNLKAVPHDFLQVNDKAIKQAIKNGERHIPGLEIKKEVTAQVRARR